MEKKPHSAKFIVIFSSTLHNCLEERWRLLALHATSCDKCALLLEEYFLFLFLFNPHPRICLLILEMGGEGGRERHWCEKHRSVASLTLADLETNPQPRWVSWMGIEPATFSWMGWCSNQLTLLARAVIFYFLSCWETAIKWGVRG